MPCVLLRAINRAIEAIKVEKTAIFFAIIYFIKYIMKFEI